MSDPSVSPLSMAVDPYTRTLYWSDAKNNVVNVTNLKNKASIGVIFNEQQPKQLAIDPLKGCVCY